MSRKCKRKRVTKVKLIRLNSAFEYSPIENKGIFYYLQSLDVPWKEKNINTKLDLFYHMNYSGGKIVSPLIDSYIVNGTITALQKQELASIIFSLYNETWARLWNIYNMQYNPINNYDMTETSEDTHTRDYGKVNTRVTDMEHTKEGTETETPDLTQTRRPNITQTRTPDLTQTRTPDLEQVTTPDKSSVTTENINGFNSDSNGVPANKSTTLDTGTETVENTGTETIENTGTETNTETGTETLENDGTDTMAYDLSETDEGSVTSTDSGQDTEIIEHELNRSGNIGTLTTQEMMQSEIALWEWNFFKNVIFPNIDGVLTISLY